MRWTLFTMALLVAATISNASRLRPPVLPLIVRNPYLSTWLGNAREPPWEKWPMFYTGQTTGLSVLARMPYSLTVYPLLGRPQDSLKTNEERFKISYPKYVGATFDAFATNLTFNIPASKAWVDPFEIVISFLSPITPTSTLRQSIPASYIVIYVNGHSSIDIYVDVSGEWVSGDINKNITWEFEDNPFGEDSNMPGLKQWKVRRTDEELFTEHQDRAEWGTLHFVGPPDVQYESGADALLRQRFARTGTLLNAVDHGFRRIVEDWPVFAFAKSFKLKELWPSGDSVRFTIAHIQDPIVQYAAPQGLIHMTPLWKSYFTTAEALINFHYFDFSKTVKLARDYSEQLAYDAIKSGSEDYQDIVALSARQVLGATSFSGTPRDPVLFLKEISSNGDFQTVDVIFPTLPFFLYTNPRWFAYLLEPLIEHQLNGLYPNKYSLHDLGVFPNATGHPDGNDEYMPVEECGNMLIMGLAIVNSLRYGKIQGSIWSAADATTVETAFDDVFSLPPNPDDFDGIWASHSDGTGRKAAQAWVRRSYQLWKQWTGYLVREALIPKHQLSTDDFAGWLANQTNLALKGILGIRAMSELSDLVGEIEDAKYYRNVSNVYIRKWEEYSRARDGTHAKLAYTWYGSWTTIYNLFADALLCFHLPSFGALGDGNFPKPIGEESSGKISRTTFIHENIYRMQSNWYYSVRQKYGLPLDSRHLYTKSDWQFFATAVTSRKVREAIVQSIALWVNETVTDRPMTDLYETENDGDFAGSGFFARPVVGGHFSYLALDRACNGKAAAGLDFLNQEEEEEEEEEEKRPFSGEKAVAGIDIDIGTGSGPGTGTRIGTAAAKQLGEL